MGISPDAWISKGAATCRAAGGHPGRGAGEGDSTGGPRIARGRKDDWPTLVIEAGYSESLNQLRADMTWWFTTSNHDVKIVLLAKFDHRQREILLEKWEEETPPSPPGAITRSRSAMLEPRQVLRQRIAINRDETTNPVSYNVARGALVLGFRLLFLRDPVPQEGDIVISIPHLQSYAEYVWENV